MTLADWGPLGVEKQVKRLERRVRHCDAEQDADRPVPHLVAYSARSMALSR